MKNVNQKEANLQAFESRFSDRINAYFIRHDSIKFRTAVALRGTYICSSTGRLTFITVNLFYVGCVKVLL